MPRRRVAIGFLVLIAAISANLRSEQPANAALTFRVNDLGTLGGTASAATALNDSGQVVGRADRADGSSHAFSWTRGEGMLDMGTLGGNTSYAADVNSAGAVTGYAETATGEIHAFSWTRTGGMVDLGTLGGSFSMATAINEDGAVTGASAVGGSGGYHAFVWRPGDAAMTDLGALGGDYSWGSALNDSGQVVGWASDGGGIHAFSWTAATGMVSVAPGPMSAAVAVNEAGQVVGSVYDGDLLRWHAFSWHAGTGLTDVGTLGGSDSFSADVNDAGQVVGWARRSDGSQHGFVWTSGGGIADLGTLGGGYSSAARINAVGEVVGSASTSGSQTHAFLRGRAGGQLADLGTLGGDSSAAVDVNRRGGAAGWGVTAAGDYHAMFVAPPTPFERLQEVVNRLPVTPREFAEARARLMDALDPTLWNASGTALAYPQGARFFDSVKQAVDRLDKVKSVEAQSAAAELWAIAQQLTSDAVGGANRQLTSAPERWLLDHSDAFERLKQAWRSAGPRF